MGFKMSKFDNSLSIWNDSRGQLFIIIYVDDLVVGGEHVEDIEHTKRLLSGWFEMTNIKELHYFLALDVIQTPYGILISRRHYILNLLFMFGMTEYKPIETPLDRN